MGNMNSLDLELIKKIRSKIEKRYNLGESNNWLQKDYEYLVFFIEDKSGYRLSLSTVKRIWKGNFNRLPHTSTLNVLSQLAYGCDWMALKKLHLDIEKEADSVEIPTIKEKRKKKLPWRSVILFSCSVLALILFLLANNGGSGTIRFDNEEPVFTYKQSAEGTIPNTVVFNYDISSVNAERFYIQQSWDESRKVEISKTHTVQTDIYYLPGYFMAKLIADDQIIRKIPVHVTYGDWITAVRQPDSTVQLIDTTSWSNVPYLAISKEQLLKKIDLEKEFQLGFYNVKEFDVDGDNFTYSSLVRMEPLEDITCPELSLLIKGEHGYFWIMYGNIGCESELKALFSEKLFDGKKHDLTKFGTSLYDWQKIQVSVVDKMVSIFLNDGLIFETKYNQSIGPIKDISYFFKGVGQIDDVMLKDAYGNAKFSDDFESNSTPD